MSIDLSLDRIRRLTAILPTYTRPTIHVAGTNGKGSVTALIDSILRASDPPLSTGRFNSPHLISVRDSILIEGQTVEEAVYTKHRAEVERLDREHQTNLRNFELLTVTALQCFESEQLDVVIIEVGMGGRLDATNVIPDEAVLLSILTDVDLDHQAFLGNTITEISREKSSICRRGRPFILSSQTHPEVEGVVRGVVDQNGGLLITQVRVRRAGDGNSDNRLFHTFSLSPSSFKPPLLQVAVAELPCFDETLDVFLPLYGDHQLRNLGVALTAISALIAHPSCAPYGFGRNLNRKTIQQGIQSVCWPGRLSFHTLTLGTGDPLIILADGAHNPASSTTLSAYIAHLLSILSPNERTIRLTYLLALSHSPPKTPLQTLTPLLPPTLPDNRGIEVQVGIATLGFTPPDEMPWVKVVPPSELSEVARLLVPDAEIQVFPGDDNHGHSKSLIHALEWASRRNAGRAGLVVVAGSLYLLADLYRYMGGTHEAWDGHDALKL